MKPSTNQIIGDICEIQMLQKFLNNPARLGMTEAEQYAEVDKIEAIGKAIANHGSQK